jgi:hypothetical protein
MSTEIKYGDPKKRTNTYWQEILSAVWSTCWSSMIKSQKPCSKSIRFCGTVSALGLQVGASNPTQVKGPVDTIWTIFELAHPYKRIKGKTSFYHESREKISIDYWLEKNFLAEPNQVYDPSKS